MRSAYIETPDDSLKIHDIDDPTCVFYLKSPVQGLDMATLRTTSANRSGEDGNYIDNILFGERRVTLNGGINAVGSESDLITKRRLFEQIVARQKDENGVLVQKVLRFTAMDGNQYRVTGQPLQSKMPLGNIRNSDFTIDWLADNPYVESYAEATATVSTRTGGGLTFPADTPFDFSASIGGASTVTNDGNAPAYPVVTLNGPLTNPRISNETTGKFISLLLTVNTGETVVIDMVNRTIVQGGVTNRMGTKSSDSKFWWLDPGDNVLSLVTTISGETGTAGISYRHSYVGI